MVEVPPICAGIYLNALEVLDKDFVLFNICPASKSGQFILFYSVIRYPMNNDLSVYWESGAGNRHGWKESHIV